MKIRISRNKNVGTAGSVYSAPSMESQEQTERSDEQIAEDDKAEKIRQEKEKKDKIEEAKKKAEEKEEKGGSTSDDSSGDSEESDSEEGDEEESGDESDDEESDDEESEDDEESDDEDDSEDDEESDDEEEEATASANLEKAPVPAHIMPHTAAQPVPGVPYPDVVGYSPENPLLGATITEKETEQKEGEEKGDDSGKVVENVSKKTRKAMDAEPEPKRENVNGPEIATAGSVNPLPYPDCKGISF